MSGPADEDDDLGFQKGDYVALKGTDETGRIVGPGSKPGWWLVRFDDAGEKEVAEDRLDPVY